MPKPVDFECNVLTEFRDAVMKRSKSLKSMFYLTDLSREIRGGKDVPKEVAVLVLRRLRSSKSVTITINTWPDRWVWIDAREGSKSGWLWSFNAEGRLAGGKNWTDLINGIKEMNEKIDTDVAENGWQTTLKIWNKLLLTGPTGVALDSQVIMTR